MSPPGAKRNIPSLDGLRAISIVLVIASHLNSRLPQTEHASAARHLLNLISRGQLGVDMFFVISGFLITRLLLSEMEKTGGVSLQRFYLRRSFRIFPAYYVFLFVVAVLQLLHSVHIPLAGLLGAATYLSNYVPYRLTLPESTGWAVGHTWSLSVEEQFYLLWPAILLSAGRRRAILIGLVVIAISPVLRTLTALYAPQFNFDEQTYRMFQNTMDVLMFGCVLALVSRSARFLQFSRWFFHPVVLVSAGLYLLTEHWATRALPWWYQPLVGMSVSALCLTILCWYATQHATTAGGRILNWAPVRHVGVISYSLYLWQQLFLGPMGVLRLPFDLLAVLCCAELSYWLIETPSLRLRERVEARLFRTRVAQ